jgi:hypothetical protein
VTFGLAGALLAHTTVVFEINIIYIWINLIQKRRIASNKTKDANKILTNTAVATNNIHPVLWFISWACRCWNQRQWYLPIRQPHRIKESPATAT